MIDPFIHCDRCLIPLKCWELCEEENTCMEQEIDALRFVRKTDTPRREL